MRSGSSTPWSRPARHRDRRPVIGGPLGAGARIALGAPSLWPVGLAAFLARGGIVLFALPILALPSVVGLTTFIGPNSVTAAGIAPRLVLLIALTTTVLVAWIVVATLIAAAADQVLVRAVVASEPDSGRALRAPDRDLSTLFVVRLVSLVPFALAVGIGGARLGQVGYQELVLPADSSAPFVTRSWSVPRRSSRCSSAAGSSARSSAPARSVSRCAPTGPPFARSAARSAGSSAIRSARSARSARLWS